MNCTLWQRSLYAVAEVTVRCGRGHCTLWQRSLYAVAEVTDAELYNNLYREPQGIETCPLECAHWLFARAKNKDLSASVARRSV